VLRPEENLPETSLHCQKEILYRDSGEGSKAERSKQNQEQTTKQEIQYFFHSSYIPEIVKK
jgi:hypothetical protein